MSTRSVEKGRILTHGQYNKNDRTGRKKTGRNPTRVDTWLNLVHPYFLNTGPNSPLFSICRKLFCDVNYRIHIILDLRAIKI